MRSVWLLGLPILSSASEETTNTEFCITQETPETAPVSTGNLTELDSVLCYWRPSFYDLINPSGEKNSSKVNSAPDVIAKKAQYKREIPEQTKEYRFYNSSNMSLDVPEKFGDYGYCFYTYVSCPLDNSSSTHINQIRCKGNYCNKNSTIETIFGSMEDAKTKLTNENRFRCLEKMEDTYCNRCVSCNSTHRAELVEGLHVDLRECSKCPPIMNLNLEKPNEHTLTYLILVILLVIAVAVYFLHMFFLRGRYPDTPEEDGNQMEDIEREPLVVDDVKIYMDHVYATINERSFFPNDLEKDTTGSTRNFRIAGSKLGSKRKFMCCLMEAQKVQKISYFSSWIFSEEDDFFYMTAFKSCTPSDNFVSLQFIADNVGEAPGAAQVVKMAHALTTKMASGTLNSFFSRLQKICRSNVVEPGVDTIFEISPKSILFDYTGSWELILLPFNDEEPSPYGNKYDVSSPQIYINKHLVSTCPDGEEHFSYQMKNMVGLIMQLMLGRNSHILYERHPFVHLVNRYNPSRQSRLGLSAGESSSCDSSAADMSDGQTSSPQMTTFSDILNKTRDFKNIEELGLLDYFCYVEEAQPIIEDNRNGFMGHVARVRPKYTHNFEMLRDQVSWELADELMDLDRRLWEHSLLWGPLNEWLHNLLINHLQPPES